MNKKTINILLTIASLGLSIGALILIIVQIFGETKDNNMLVMAFSAIIIANLFNVIRGKLNKDSSTSEAAMNSSDNK